jgi:parvulin-like peptidyl-prolyl isomerase
MRLVLPSKTPTTAAFSQNAGAPGVPLLWIAASLAMALAMNASAQIPLGGAGPATDPYFSTSAGQAAAAAPGSPMPNVSGPSGPAPGGWPAAATLPADAGAPRAEIASLPSATRPRKPNEASLLFQPAETVARIGEECIFRGDLEGDAELILATVVVKMTPEEREKNRAQLLEQKEKLVEQLLKQAIDRKLLYLDFIRSQPTDKLKDLKANIDKKIGEAFDEDLLAMVDKMKKTKEEEYGELIRQDNQLFRIALFMSQQNIPSVYELDRAMKQLGTTRRYQQQAYAERKLGQQQLYRSINTQPEIMPDEMLKYYREHEQQYLVPMRAKWERLCARFDRFPDKTACGAAIAAMGNEVMLGGAPFAAVAKRSSQTTDAEKGGFHEWTDWGDLAVSRPLHEAIFSLPLNQLSGIIEDAEGLHIIRVLERDETHMIPFTEAQVEIKKTLQSQKRSAEITKYIEKLHKRTPVWLASDNPAASPNTP